MVEQGPLKSLVAGSNPVTPSKEEDMSRLSLRQIMADIDNEKLMSYTVQGDMNLRELLELMLKRIEYLEEAVVDYGLLVYEDDEDVRIQSKSNKGS